MGVRVLIFSSPASSRGSSAANPTSSSLRTSRASSQPNSAGTVGATPPGLPFCSMSSANWSAWVTAARHDYSARLKSAPRTSASASSSWPSASTRDWKDTQNRQGRRQLPAKIFGQQALDNANTAGSPHASPWATPCIREGEEVGSPRRHSGVLNHQVRTWPTPYGFMGDAGNPRYGGGGEFAKFVKKHTQ